MIRDAIPVWGEARGNSLGCLCLSGKIRASFLSGLLLTCQSFALERLRSPIQLLLSSIPLLASYRGRWKLTCSRMTVLPICQSLLVSVFFSNPPPFFFFFF